MQLNVRVALSALVMSLAIVGPASAQHQIAPGAVQAARQPIVVMCQGSERSPFANALLCLGFAEITINSDGPGAMIGLQLTAPTTHCSDIQYYVQRVATETGVTSVRLPPGASQTLPIASDLPRGAHRYRIWGWGYIGGCMVDEFHSFGVTAVPVIVP
ncbi:MAG: hypothetical protein A4S17_12650 [Proteobacteria bacterium HN_bin10]|nr:MAG: hypothetical protein A4S17_12650 [Proteobacteria bacterium HN_bin10]